MKLTAYFDESGTHGGSHATVMAGVLGNEHQWKRFDVEFDKIRRQFGFRIFHATEFKRRQGEFKGWSDDKAVRLLRSLGLMTDACLSEGVVVPIPSSGYKDEFQAGAKPKRFRLDTAYGLGFRICLTHLLTEIIRRYGTHKKAVQTRLHVVLEQGAKNAGDAERVFNEMRQEFRDHGWDLLESFRLAQKATPPLMIADFLSFSTWAMTGEGYKAEDMIEPHAGTSGAAIAHLEFEDGSLQLMKEHLIAEWLEGRRRKQAGSPAP